MARWSPDGSMIAAYAVAFDLQSGALLNRGIFIADVLYDGNRPVGAVNLRHVISTGGDRNFAWSPDSRRIVFVEAGVNGADLFMYQLDGGATTNITNTPGIAEDQPAYSVNERIAYTRQSSDPRGSYRYDIFSIPATGGAETQITSKSTTGSFVNMLPGYSPDGQQISFSSGLLQGDRALYRIRADGSGKAVKIVGSKGQDWRVSYWRQ
jgi:Tol biopolymer transport system component